MHTCTHYRTVGAGWVYEGQRKKKKASKSHCEASGSPILVHLSFFPARKAIFTPIFPTQML